MLFPHAIETLIRSYMDVYDIMTCYPEQISIYLPQMELTDELAQIQRELILSPWFRQNQDDSTYRVLDAETQRCLFTEITTTPLTCKFYPMLRATTDPFIIRTLLQYMEYYSNEFIISMLNPGHVLVMLHLLERNLLPLSLLRDRLNEIIGLGLHHVSAYVMLRLHGGYYDGLTSAIKYAPTLIYACLTRDYYDPSIDYVSLCVQHNITLSDFELIVKGSPIPAIRSFQAILEGRHFDHADIMVKHNPNLVKSFIGYVVGAGHTKLLRTALKYVKKCNDYETVVEYAFRVSVDTRNNNMMSYLSTLLYKIYSKS